jgi:CO/xanthine dehydrogenase Mo-binding subunit
MDAMTGGGMERPASERPASERHAGHTVIGQPVRRLDAAAKLRGETRFVDDLPRAGVWVGGTVRSPVPHGRLLGLRFDPAFDWSRVSVVTARDIPGENVCPIVYRDQPMLAFDRVRYCGDPIALIAAEDEETLQRALDAVAVDIEPLASLFDMRMAESTAAAWTAAKGRGDASASTVAPPVYGMDNVYRRIEIKKGDAAAALASAALVVEGEYETGAQEHLYLEPQAIQAERMADGVLLRGSMQCPYYLVEAVAVVLGIAESQVRVAPCAAGGGFGGKEDFPSLLAGHAALLAWKSGRPVRMVYERVEDIRYTSKRHPSWIRHRTGFTADGRLVAMEVELLLDGGAYSTLSPLVLQRAAVHAAGPYRCGNVSIDARAVATNHPPRGAFRGFGGPQAAFAMETHLDRCAARLGIDPVELRSRNLVRPGDTLATGQTLGADGDAHLVLERALAESRYGERRAEFAAFNMAADSRTGVARFHRRGIGLSCFMHGTGLNGNAEGFFRSRVFIDATREGRFRVFTSQIEMGQGTETIVAQLAAEGLGVSMDSVELAPLDTAFTPNSGPTVASRTAAVVGRLLIEAGRKLRGRVERFHGGPLGDEREFRAAAARLAADGPVREEAEYTPPPGFAWDEARHRGDAYLGFSWGCYVVELEVDVLTGETRVLGVTAVQDIGCVVNPLLASGQVEGGVVQALGWALMETAVWREGQMVNANMTDYVIPTAVDAPPIRVVFLEQPLQRLPHGAKGLGELPHEGPAPAVANALRQALNGDFTAIPITPETILAKLPGSSEGSESQTVFRTANRPLARLG